MASGAQVEIQVATARHEQIPLLQAACDEEFIFSRGRKLSLSRRFGDVWALANARNISVATSAGEPVGTAAARHFTYRNGAETWHCAAIGMVWTRASHRKQGIGAKVMTHLVSQLTASGCDALFLWTSIPKFYEAFGFITEDGSVFGAQTPAELSLPPTAKASSAQLLPFDASLISQIEDVRSRHAGTRVDRTLETWASIPVPAETLWVALAADAYALWGRQGDTAFLYEMVGETGEFNGLIRALRGARPALEKIYFNDCAGNASATHLEKAGVSLQPQSLTMWKPLTPHARDLAPIVHIPYFDRI